MNYKDLNICRSYISCGVDNISDSFLVPALKFTKKYKRSVGFFSSGVFKPIVDGVVALSRNNGTIQLVASPQLTEQDVEAINTGYEQRDKVIQSSFSRDFNAVIEKFDDDNLKMLAALICRGVLDIKIAVTDTLGIYHDKMGVLEDFDGNIVAFYGSANSSINGYRNNYEKIRVVKNWIDGDVESVTDEISEFEALWNGTNPYIKTYDYSKCAHDNILKIVDERQQSPHSNAPVKLRDYQKEAINAWVNNDYKGFFVMATGTGKTWTAIYAAKELVKLHPSMIVICAPYKHLVKQWSEDVANAFSQSTPILVSSENPTWEIQIKEEIIKQNYQRDKQIIIISTIASFKTERFWSAINASSSEKLLIVDEAHRFTKRSESLKIVFQYMLGLSATPFSGSSATTGRELMEYFGGQVFNLPIEEALNRKFLVPYNYYPIFVHATQDEQQMFQSYTHKILSCFKNNRCVNPDLLVKSLRGRLRVISMAEEKINGIDFILNHIKEKDHFVVYCGDGHLFDSNTGEDIRHIQSVKRTLTSHGYKSSQFTASENMNDRMELVDSFNKGEISALAAIRCLDEGINIPSIKSALILSSNDDYREFVQRRGRILRTYDGKEYANIYDVIVLPTTDMTAWAKIEFRRFHEYACLAQNWNSSLENELHSYLSEYNLAIEDVDVFDYDDMEDTTDE